MVGTQTGIQANPTILEMVKIMLILDQEALGMILRIKGERHFVTRNCLELQSASIVSELFTAFISTDIIRSVCTVRGQENRYMSGFQTQITGHMLSTGQHF